MSPHDPVICAGYFEEPIGQGDWIQPAVSFLRARLSSCQLRYIACSPDGAELFGEELFETLEETQHAVPEDAAMVATVLIFEPVD